MTHLEVEISYSEETESLLGEDLKGNKASSQFHRGHPIYSLMVLDCSFQVGFKRVSTTCRIAT